MKQTKRFTSIAIGILVLLGCAVSANVKHSDSTVGVYSGSDALFSETITLHTDGKYQQSEKMQKNKGPLDFLNASTRSGTWRILEKENGLPIAFKAGQAFPESAVIELKEAMPFGYTWENQLPFRLKGNRTLPASSFFDTAPSRQINNAITDAKSATLPANSGNSQYHITISSQK